MTTQQKLVVTYHKDQSYQELVLANHNFHAFTVEPMIRLDNASIIKRDKYEKNKNLKDIVFQNKVKLITKNFIRKLRRNTVNRQPLEGLQDHQVTPNYFWGKLQTELKVIITHQGFALQNWSLVFWNVINIVQTVMIVFVFSMLMTFPEVEENLFFQYVRIMSCVFYAVDIILNFTSQRYENGKKLQLLGQISKHYLKNGFMIDFATAVIFPLSFALTSTPINILLALISIMKFFNSIKKFQKIQYLVIGSRQKQHYYGLIKVFLTNFMIGHILSVLLNSMPSFDSDQNWHIKLGILNEAWYIKYIWGYYWGTNIMLTVGFGDISATNYIEAIMLVFIQTFSCITLAYNISNVGALISSIRQNQEAKKRKLKTFHRMCKQNDVNSAISSKISNFIEQAYQIKQAFQHDARDEVLEFLPKQIQRQYRKEANKILFDGLGFLSNLSKKSLLTLAEQVNRKVCHPEEIIVRKDSISDFYILQKGIVGFACKTRSNLDGKVIQELVVQGNSKPKILSLDFIKNKIVNYNIKSMNYSVLCYLSRENFLESLKGSEMDYQLFCVLKDKDECVIDQNNLYLCPNCENQYHNKFECTRIHYIPLKLNIIFKYLQNAIQDRHERRSYYRTKIRINPCLMVRELIYQQQRFIVDNFDSDHYRQIQQLINFYQQNLGTKQDKTMTQKHLIQSKRKKNMLTNHQLQFKNLIEEKAIYKLEELMQANKKQNRFWEFQIDLAYDFKYYFKEGNPESLLKTKKRKYKHSNLYFLNNKSNKQY